jgi:adenylate kinase family enzyme
MARQTYEPPSDTRRPLFCIHVETTPLVSAILHLIHKTQQHQHGCLMLITLFGKPESGKTTLGDLMESQEGFLHLALSRLLKRNSFLSLVNIFPEDVEHAMNTAQTITSPFLFDWLDDTIANASRSVVIDGYPREPIALERFNSLARRLSARRQVIGVRLICPRQVAIQRLLARKRPDDRPELIDLRLNEYTTVQRPLFNHLDPCIRKIETDLTDAAAICALILCRS